MKKRKKVIKKSPWLLFLVGIEMALQTLPALVIVELYFLRVCPGGHLEQIAALEHERERLIGVSAQREFRIVFISVHATCVCVRTCRRAGRSCKSV